jgi:hypothetical protein
MGADGGWECLPFNGKATEEKFKKFYFLTAGFTFASGGHDYDNRYDFQKENPQISNTHIMVPYGTDIWDEYTFLGDFRFLTDVKVYVNQEPFSLSFQDYFLERQTDPWPFQSKEIYHYLDSLFRIKPLYFGKDESLSKQIHDRFMNEQMKVGDWINELNSLVDFHKMFSVETWT